MWSLNTVLNNHNPNELNTIWEEKSLGSIAVWLKSTLTVVYWMLRASWAISCWWCTCRSLSFCLSMFNPDNTMVSGFKAPDVYIRRRPTSTLKTTKQGCRSVQESDESRKLWLLFVVLIISMATSPITSLNYRHKGWRGIQGFTNSNSLELKY